MKKREPSGSHEKPGRSQVSRVTSSPRSPGITRSVEVAFRVLEGVAELQPVGVSELSRALGLPKSTVQRALQSLNGLHYIFAVHSHGDLPRWSLTLRPSYIGSLASARLGLRDVALPEMHHLLESTQEAVHLNVLEGRFVVVLEKLDSNQAVRAYTAPGEHAPANASATGKAILAESPQWVVDAFLSEPLTRLSDRTIVDPDEFRAELQATRERGYATNLGERRSDVGAVAAAIRDAEGQPVAGIGVSAPLHRFPGEVSERVAQVVLTAALRVSARLGWRQGGT